MTVTEPGDAPPLSCFADGLATRGDTPALITADTTLTYTRLDDRVSELASRLGETRRLVLLVADNTVDAIVAYLAALRGQHPVLLAPASDDRALDALVDAYQPDVVVGRAGHLIEQRPRSAHELHPDLALLLSTSGSTGTPKLVRLSWRNVEANAAAIAEYLALGATDRAITTLPMQYCYGLSVINSHLYAGAGIVLSNLSVVDRCFWDLVDVTGVTGFAGVPHTFDLLDRVRFETMEVPTLRYLTQAGGRMAPETVQRYAQLGEQRGWQLFVMYGQTEATARMAYLSPQLASTHPAAIGIAIPGTTLTIDQPDHNGMGELVHRGPNVMLGYATAPADLAAGRTIDELRTGDLARQNVDGLYEIVGRRNRFIKPFGVRIDLDDLERLLATHGITTLCTGDDGQLAVAVEATSDITAAIALIAERLRLPSSRLRAVQLDTLPRLPNGKADYAAVRRATRHADDVPCRSAAAHLDTADAVRATFAEVLDVEPTDDDSFVTLGGDSLSYVELSVHLEELLGALPRDWHTTPIRDFAATSVLRRRWWAPLETSVVLRAAAIVLIVGTHTGLWHHPGGAHSLLAVAGFNFARFQLGASTMLASIIRIALPSMGWIGIVAATTDDFAWSHALLVNGQFGAADSRWAYWFIEALVQMLVPLVVVFAAPAVARFEQRRPFAVAAAAVAMGLVVRYAMIDVTSTHRISRPHEVFWLFALGWAAARATTWPRRLLVTAVAAGTVVGFFGDVHRELIVIGALALVVWVPTLAVPRPAIRAVAPVAGASLYIYLTHFQIYPTLDRTLGPAAAVAASLAVGVAVWIAAQRLMAEGGARYRRWTVVR